MRSTPLLRLLAALATFVLLAAACGGSDSDDEETTDPDATEEVEATDEDTADEAEAADEDADADAGDSGDRVSTYIGQPESLTPINNTESEGSAVIAALFDTLIDYDPATNEPVMTNAESITTDDNQNYVVTLKDGYTFHDGTPVTAQSYVDTWNYAAYAPNAQSTAGFFAPIEGYADLQCGTTTQTNDDGEDEEVADCEGSPPAAETLSGLTVDSDSQFTITLSAPEPFFLTRLGYNAYAPLPQAFFDDPDGFDRAPIGNGPFMMNGEWEDDVQILTDAYPDYAGDNPAQISGVEFAIFADINTAVTSLIAGEIDIHDAVPPEQWANVTGQLSNFDQSASSSINYIGFPTYAAPFDNPDLRAALSMAIDREAITTGIFEGQRQPAFNILAPVIPGYEDTVCDEWTYNPELAAERFEAAGGLDAIGDSIEVWFNEGGGHETWMDAVITNWEQNLGIPADSVTFQQLPFAEYLELADGAQFSGPFRLGWGMDYPHPQNYLQILLELTAEEGGNNATYWTDDDYSSKIAEALAVPDVEASIPVWQEANAIACAATPAAPMFYGQNSFAWNDGVSGVAVNAFGQLDYTALKTN